MKVSIELTDIEEKVLNAWLGVDGMKDWIQHVGENKLRQRIDASILEWTNLNPKKMTQENKMIELDKITFPTKEERKEGN